MERKKRIYDGPDICTSDSGRGVRIVGKVTGVMIPIPTAARIWIPTQYPVVESALSRKK